MDIEFGNKNKINDPKHDERMNILWKPFMVIAVVNLALLSQPSSSFGQPRYACDDYKITTSDLAMRDLFDVGGGVKAGTMKVVTVNVTNNDKEIAVPAVILVEIRDSDDITQFLGFQITTLRSNSTIQIGMSWEPKFPGEYQMRSFVISDFENPQVLSCINSAVGVVS